jgi:23S rRNA (uridine2552-2'-O)-methyltransferase
LTKEWIRQRKRDPYYRKAKSAGYRSRAAYKIKQIDSRLHLFRKGTRVLDLGASPGGWSQYVSEKVGSGGKVVAVDLISMDPIQDVVFIRGDINDPSLIERIREESSEFDVIMSDISPSLSGNRTLDRGRSLAFAWEVLKMSRSLLRKGGSVVVKMFQGDEIDELKEEYGGFFRTVENHKPKSSLKRSIELYLVFRGYEGRPEE